MSQLAQLSGTVKIFYSYSHRDESLREQLGVHLSAMRRQGWIEDWHDRKIIPGQKWADEIDHHLETAHLILLLVSADFIASDYCYEIEMKRALELHEERKARVIPIILRPADWHITAFEKLQALPQNALPVTTWPNADEAWLDVARGVRAVVEDFRKDGKHVIRPATAPEDVPPLLPYLCNRNLQERALSAALAGRLPHRPFVCIIHGEKDESHDRFCERLQKNFLPIELELQAEQSVAEIRLNWPEPEDRASLDEVFRSNLSDKVFERRSAKGDEIINKLDQFPAMVIHTTLYARDWEPNGAAQLAAFLRFWDSCPDLKQRQRLVICLFLKYESAPRPGWPERFKKLWAKNKDGPRAFLERLSWADYPQLYGAVLPELRGIRLKEAEEFAREINDIYRSLNRRFSQGEFFDTYSLLDEIAALYARAELLKGNDQIAMDKLAKALLPLLQKHRQTPLPAR